MESCEANWEEMNDETIEKRRKKNNKTNDFVSCVCVCVEWISWNQAHLKPKKWIKSPFREKVLETIRKFKKKT